MILNFGKLFQIFSKDKTMRGVVSIPNNPNEWPKEWIKIYYKTYDRFPKIDLHQLNEHDPLFSTFKNRESKTSWSGLPISLETLSKIISYSAGEKSTSSQSGIIKRMQPSGGARYPVEIYVVVYKKGDLEERLYHFNVKENKIDVLWQVTKEERERFFNYPWAKDASVAIFLTGVPARVSDKYGERGYRYMYYEAGAIASVMQITASNLGLNSIIVGGSNDLMVESALDIDGENETLLISLLLG